MENEKKMMYEVPRLEFIKQSVIVKGGDSENTEVPGEGSNPGWDDED